MGIEPFLIASSVVGVIAQRLVRRVCRDCAETVSATLREKEIFSREGLQIDKVLRGRGCPACNNTGYKGRIAIHEILPINRTVRDYILQRKGIPTIMDYMKREGYRTLLGDGFLKVLNGLTTTEEVLRVATVE